MLRATSCHGRMSFEVQCCVRLMMDRRATIDDPNTRHFSILSALIAVVLRR
jgi:hypothetical protein